MIEGANGVVSPAQKRIRENRTLLVGKGIEHSMFVPTKVGLKKSILDATRPVQEHFKLIGFHDYDQQMQGPESKVIKTAYFMKPDGSTETTMSIYRPVTKKGDPRMWFKGLGEYADPDDQVAIILYQDIPYIINLSNFDLNSCLLDGDEIGGFLLSYYERESSISNELLEKLRLIARKPLKSVGTGDTTIGMTIESALEIPANSSKAPDYKGIELKSARKKKSRSTLFAQVPDWSKSVCQSSAEILNKYGYQRAEDFKLYCTVSAQKSNPQGLKLEFRSADDELVELHDVDGDVVVWSGKKLRDRLAEKHNETFWVEAKSEVIDDKEYFHLKSITHTKRPLLSQFMSLIEDGTITMDHLIKRTPNGKSAREKGPLFKIDKKNLGLLFPEPVTYSLV